jgi:putative ABC transport system permease protein
MSIGGFIARNALRNKRRALLSILSVAMSLFLLVILLVGLREITVPPEDIGAAARVIVRNKISLANMLPAKQRPIIERIPGVEAVTPFTWYGGAYKNEEGMTFAQFAIDPKVLATILGEAKLIGSYEAFANDQTSCMIGKKTADKYGLKVGDRLPLKGTMAWPFDLDFKIAAIYYGTIDDRNMFFHHKYFDEANGDAGIVSTWWVKAKTLEDVPRVVAAINKAFENTSGEVRAETERAFQLGFVSMWGNIKGLIHSICTVVVFTLFLVSASTMSMAIRERFRELAILKAVGFRRRELFAFILAESFGLAGLGALFGVGGAWALCTFGNIPAMTNNIFMIFEVTPRIIGISCTVAASLGLLAAIAPSIAVARMSVVEGLKTLD